MMMPMLGGAAFGAGGMSMLVTTTITMMILHQATKMMVMEMTPVVEMTTVMIMVVDETTVVVEIIDNVVGIIKKVLLCVSIYWMNVVACVVCISTSDQSLEW